jgi:hypothetical protein
MQELLNKVIEARKGAEANLIVHREDSVNLIRLTPAFNSIGGVSP